MNVSELIKRLQVLPSDAVVTYYHNQHGVIDIEEIEEREDHFLSGKTQITIILKGAKE